MIKYSLCRAPTIGDGGPPKIQDTWREEVHVSTSREGHTSDCRHVPKGKILEPSPRNLAR